MNRNYLYMHSWYVVHTKSKQEVVAVENLTRQGYTTYLPQIKLSKRIRKHWSKVIEPLFPRYLFIKLIEGVDDFSPVRSTMGVSSLLRFGGHPAKVSQPVIDSIRMQEAEFQTNETDHPDWKNGDVVELLEGPLSGFKGIYDKQNSDERVIVLLDILGRRNQLEIDKNFISSAI